MTTWRAGRGWGGRAGVLIALAVAGAAVAAREARAQESSFRWSGSMSAGQLLDVRGISGDMRVELASGSTAEVVAEKRGRESDFDEVEVRTVKEADGVTICVVYYPEEHPGNDCDLDDHDRGDRHHRRSLRVSVDYVVKVPAGVELIGSMVSGDVDVRDVRSDVTASSVSGDVTVSTTGVVRASTVSGSLDIEMGSTDWRDLSYHTVSGDITLRLPADIATEVEFESLSGDLDSDFDLHVDQRRHRWVGAHIRGSIGDGGGRSLAFNTVSGDVRLRKAR